MRIGISAAVAVIVLSCATGCQKAAPEGQVVATINDAEITSRDIQAEMTAAQVPDLVDPKALAPLVLDRLVSRRLVADEAKRIGLEKTPEYIALQRRADELLLSQMLLDRWARALPPPSEADIGAEIVDNPQRYGAREQLLLERIAIKGKFDASKIMQAHSLDDVAAYLNLSHVQFVRGRQAVDSAAMPRASFNQINAVPAGEPLIETREDGTVISALVARQSAPLSVANQRSAAISRLKGQAIDGKVKALRKGMKIDYQPGYAPPQRGAVAPPKR